VKIDNREAAAMAVNHLADLGHRRIGHVAGPPGNVLTEARQAGWQEACIARGLTPDPALLYPGDFGLDSGQRAARLWLDQPKDSRPTAVFLASDEMACGFIGEVLRHGIRVPQDLSVVGFDDIELVAHIAPPLTTIRQPRNQLGRIAAERLLARLEGRVDDTDTVLPVELVLRGSTAPPRG
jgi:LacI family repressor for deo operon, udp, cdd, tsx, nupC, and nupG